MTKTSAEIELEVEATRGNLDRTVEALKGKMSPGQLVDEVSTLMGSGGRQVLSRLGEQARENPMPLAVMGVGLAWLMMGNRHAGSRHDYRGGGAGYGFTATNGHDGASLTEKVGDKLHDVADAVTGAAGATRDAVTHTASGAADKVAYLASEAADRFSQARRQIRTRYADTLQSEPLIIGAVGLAVGLAAGAAIPASELEDRYLGGLRDDVVDKVQAFAGEHMHTARDVAAAAYAGVKDEVVRSSDMAAAGATDDGARVL